jgi:hypothetical protein
MILLQKHKEYGFPIIFINYDHPLSLEIKQLVVNNFYN